MIRSPLFPLLLVIGSCAAMVAPAQPAAALQALSPSRNRPVQSGEDDRIDNALGQANAANVEPSKALLDAMNKMIPIEIIGSELEAPMREIARKFLTGSTGEAVAELEALHQANPELPPPPVLVSGMLFTAGNTAQARQWLEKAAAEFPEYPTSFNGFARLAISDRRIADAEALLEKVQRLIETGSWSEAQMRLFRIEYLDGVTDVAIARQQLDAARSHLQELQQFLPENDRVVVRLAQIEFDLGNTDASLGHLNSARSLNPEIRIPEVIISEWYLRKKDWDASEKWIVAAADANPEDAAVQLDHARWLLQNEKLPEALAAVQKAEELGMSNYIVEYLRGQVAFARRSYGVAEMHFQQILDGRPGDADATNMLALSLIESDDESKQSRGLELAVMNQRMYPRSATAMASVGWIYYRMGKLAEAEAAFRQVIAAGSLEPSASYFVAAFLNQRGEYQNAQQLLESAIASRDYFMFRDAAADLLNKVNTRLAAQSDPAQQPNDAAQPDDGN